MADITKSVPHITEELVLGKTVNIRPTSVSALAALAGVPVKGLYLVSYTVDLANLAANTTSIEEVTITDSNHTVRVAVGDLFIPVAFTGLDAGLVLAPQVAVTADKAAIRLANVTVGAINEASGTVTALWIKVA